ncbi:MAG: S41 family peptidase [Anaerolineae bacterium]|nr:S41 family peptidase [Anaerolineae bacterium]
MSEIQSNNGEFKTALRAVLLILGLVIVSLVIFSAGFTAGSMYTSLQAPASSGEQELSYSPLLTNDNDQLSGDQADMTVFWEAWDTIEDRFYYDIPSEEERVQGAIYGLVGSLGDPYTAYIPPDAAQIINEDSTGSYEGIGAFVEDAPGGGVYIFRVFEGGPAEEAGLLAGDIVIAVDGVDISQKYLRESLLLIRGPADTQVVLTVYREGIEAPFDVEVTRARLEIPIVESRMLDDNIGYVALYEFNARASSRLREEVEGLMDNGAESIIFDLRDNPGGFLDESVSVADMFLQDGLILIQRDVDGQEREFRATNGDFAESIPLVVLINRNSASASEIVAAAIKDNDRGTLIGETSFGKGSVQIQYNLSDGSLLRVTYANWYTPNDVSITGNGVEPDIIVESPLEPTEDDVQLERAIEFLTNEQ